MKRDTAPSHPRVVEFLSSWPVLSKVTSAAATLNGVRVRLSSGEWVTVGLGSGLDAARNRRGPRPQTSFRTPDQFPLIRTTDVQELG